MKMKIQVLFLFCILITSTLFAQNLNPIFNNVTTIWPGGLPGHLAPLNASVTPIVSSSLCNGSNLLHYSVATSFQSGRVIGMAHEGILTNTNIGQVDNLTFLTNTIDWLNTGNKRVTLKSGWINNGNTSTLQNTLSTNGFTFNTISSITSSSLSNTDVLILGNDWNGNQPYTAAELNAISSFVSNGGGLLITGLGWSWSSSLSQYPMNQAANLFGFEFTTDAIYDTGNAINGYTTFSNFYPNNVASNFIPYCPSPFVGTNIARGDTLRVLRLAVSSMGEFTQQSGGVNPTIALMNTWLDDINDIYGREYCVRFELIPNNSQLIFADPNTDPWSTLPAGSGGCTNANLILNEQATVIDGIIGAANYDISHVIAGSPFGGGCAGGLKSGLSGGFNIPVTRHEMGHQFSQSHTINHTSRNNYEPENGGWSIQGGNGHGYAHAVSYHQLANNLISQNANIGTKVPTGNHIPTVDAGADAIIPISTPFTLTGIASDNDTQDALTYIWDNMDRGIAQTIPVADDLQGALFMRLLPSAEASRTFPAMADVVANNNSNGQEQLPTQARTIPIRLTVNDNHQMVYNGNTINASGSNSDDIIITVAEAGPFEVTSQNMGGIVYDGGTSQTITWNVNGTDTLPINTQFVKISLSTDGGFTYPTTLITSTANNGTAIVTLPNINTTTARIKVEAINSIYFDINTENFEIKKDNTLSTDKLTSFAPKIYPNPAKNFIEIVIKEPIKYTVTLYDLRGRTLISEENSVRLNISKIPSGVYIIEILANETLEKVNKKITILK